MEFHIIKSDNHTNARAAKLITDHGAIETPIFMPVGTIGSVKGIHNRELQNDVNAEIILRKYIPFIFKTWCRNN